MSYHQGCMTSITPYHASPVVHLMQSRVRLPSDAQYHNQLATAGSGSEYITGRRPLLYIRCYHQLYCATEMNHTTAPSGCSADGSISVGTAAGGSSMWMSLSGRCTERLNPMLQSVTPGDVPEDVFYHPRYNTQECVTTAAGRACCSTLACHTTTGQSGRE